MSQYAAAPRTPGDERSPGALAAPSSAARGQRSAAREAVPASAEGATTEAASAEGAMTEAASFEAASTAGFAAAFEAAFQQVYLRFHRRDGRRSALPNASRAVLLHLAQSGPLTVSEAARHLDRAQSVVSEIVTHLEHKGLLEREADPHDRRRTLVWLTPAGFAELERDAQVLSRTLLERAATHLDADTRTRVLTALGALLAAEQTAHLAAEPAAPTERNES